MLTLRHVLILLLLLMLGCADFSRQREPKEDTSTSEKTIAVLDASGPTDTQADVPQSDGALADSHTTGPDGGSVDTGSGSDESPDASTLDRDPTGGPDQVNHTDDTTSPEPTLADDVTKPEAPTKPERTPPPPDKPTVTNMGKSGFRVLHWNIAGGKENNCQATGITRAVMRFVRDFSQPVDFVNLNEVCEAQFNAIRDELRKHWNKKNSDTFAIFQPVNPRKVGIALFSRENLRNITRNKIGNDQYGDRYVICGRQVGRRVRLCGTHLTPADTTARKQLALVMTQLQGFWKNHQDTIIFAGDLNIHPHDTALNDVYSAAANTPNNPGNKGAYRELDDDDAAHCKGYGERTVPSTTGGPCKSGGKIDFIFARQNRIVNGNYNADSLDIPQDCTGACSDHRALRGYVQIEYRTD